MILNKKQTNRIQETGRVHWFDQKNKILYKIYKKENLLDSATDLDLRLSQIVELSSSMNFIPEISYTYENDLLIMRQNKLAKDGRLDKIEPFEKKLTLAKEFAQSLDRLHAKGFVHGDINRKNIIYSNDRLNLIDFEPSLLQIKNHAKQWMSTRPYIHQDDMQSNTVTIKSDLLGFGCFLSWFLETYRPPQDYADECSIVINENKLGPSPFKKFVEIILEKINFKAPVLSQEEIQMHIENIASSFVDETNPYDYSRPSDSLLDVAVYVDAIPSGQAKDNQIYKLADICEDNKWYVTKFYIEKAPKSKASKEQTEWIRMVDDANQKKFSKVVVWSKDTLSKSKLSLMNSLAKKDNFSIDIFSYK